MTRTESERKAEKVWTALYDLMLFEHVDPDDILRELSSAWDDVARRRREIGHDAIKKASGA